ncbi:hypothetical protein SLEP1_g57651 [Rubroshorea leprosula]|uniref:Uncharacterized protein n=1 Tax=Rubroshorea leprosula TaxID=152421 RepID=A0AAV5MN39_9ROSI|nr:hypothetical protein SLEP1_g57651 [Rubroshorea leprosula]
MASFSSALIIVSSQTPIPRTKFSEIKKINLKITPTSFPTAPKFTTSQCHKIVSKPQKTFSYLSTQPFIADESCLENSEVVEVLKQILGKVGADSFECLAMIDAVQRLGIDHYFVRQNEEVLGKKYALFCENGLLGRNLYKAALSFRLLRQHGYQVPAGIFNVFKDGKGRFKHELSTDITGWWNNLGLGKELEFVRDQPVKWHIWSSACLADPSLSEERIELTKPISLIYVIDDIFDVKGSLEELTLFTEVINRWDYAAIERLPGYMKICLTKENVEVIDNNPGIISSVATILRLWDDLGSAKDENQEGHDGSYVHFYIKEHQGVREEEARNHVNQMISKAWKQLNQECLFPNPFSSSFKNASLNFARMLPFLYSYDENQRLPSLEDYMKSLL